MMISASETSTDFTFLLISGSHRRVTYTFFMYWLKDNCRQTSECIYKHPFVCNLKSLEKWQISTKYLLGSECDIWNKATTVRNYSRKLNNVFFLLFLLFSDTSHLPLGQTGLPESSYSGPFEGSSWGGAIFERVPGLPSRAMFLHQINK